MRIDKIYIEEFKNLREFSIDLNGEQMSTVFLGQNAAGKSNLLEAIVIIFRDLDLEEHTNFNYSIEYECKNNLLKVDGGPNVRGKFIFYKGEKLNNSITYSTLVSKAVVKRDKSEYLPKYVFSYYSGISNRLLEHFDKHQTRFYKALLDGVDAPPRPLFYARQIHSYFVLMAFYAFSDEKVSKFLEDFLGIIGLESVLFVLKEPIWAKNKKDAEPLNFWTAKGVVRNFLDDLWNASMAPIVQEDNVREDFRRSHVQEQLYLFISNQDKLIDIAKKYGTNTEFFKSLESTYISDLIQEVRVKVKKVNVNGKITFKELSEGEQQLLTVLGLLRFTKEDESLILLDEPDTHLNPLWKWKYMNLLEEYSGKDETSQILMTTHDPLVIGGLTKEEIRIFYSKKAFDKDGIEFQKIVTFEPDFDPKGLGVAGILTSEFFNLPAAMDEDTFNELNRKRELEVLDREGKLNDDEKVELQKLILKLAKVRFEKVQRDPLYDKFIQAVYENPDLKKPSDNLEERKKQNEQMATIIKELMDEEKKK
ncbi:AAA family ATPase [Mariniflexile sp.]|uniref:AAA family ATPase n=1 Tax=Mariniflexile sp. TaxID=1979402 RepID=UPI0040479022